MPNVDSPKYGPKLGENQYPGESTCNTNQHLNVEASSDIIFPDLILCSPPSREYFGSVGGLEADLGNKPNKATCPLSLTPPPLFILYRDFI